MNINPRRQLIISLLAGLAVAGGVTHTLNKTKKEVASHFTMTDVWVAKKYLKRGTRLDPSQLKKIQVPEAFLQPTAIQKEETLFSDKGESPFRTRIEILKGEQITRSRIYDEKSILNLAYNVPVGQTALTLQLNMADALGGLLQPGDWVYAWWISESNYISMILDRSVVLAVNDRIWDPSSSTPGKSPKNDLHIDMAYITLAVTPKQAALLRLAQKIGDISLSLASPLDVTPIETIKLGPHTLP